MVFMPLASKEEWIKKRFREERHLFARMAPESNVSSTTLKIVKRFCNDPHGPCGDRDVALARWTKKGVRIEVVERALKLPKHNLIALLRHELGHVADPFPNKEGAEQRADDIAEIVTGEKIRYDAVHLQTVKKVGTTYPRPKHLHQ